MYHCDTIRPSDISQADRSAWIALIEAGGLRSPLFHPDFARTVGALRDDTRIALIRNSEGRLDGVFAHHRRPDGYVRPIGSVFSDLHAIHLRSGAALEIGEILRLAGIRAFRFSALLPPGPETAADATGDHGSMAAVIGKDGAAYLDERASIHRRKFKAFRRLLRKLDAEHGGSNLVVSSDPARLETLMAWKREQFRTRRRHDVLNAEWSATLMRRLHAGGGGDVRGRLIALEAGGRMIAGEFGPSWGGVFHPWVAAYDTAWSAYSPGHLLVHRLIEAMPELGLTRYEMGAGCEDYKKYFASEITPVRAGLAQVPGLQAWTRAKAAGLWSGAVGLCGRRATEASARAQRRMEVIFATETGPFARLKGVTRAAGVMLKSG